MIPFARLKIPFLKTATHLAAGFLAAQNFQVAVVVNLAGEVFDHRRTHSLQSSTQTATMSFQQKRLKEVQPFVNRSTPTVTENSLLKSLIQKASDVVSENSSEVDSFLTEVAKVTPAVFARSGQRSMSNPLRNSAWLRWRPQAARSTVC